VAGFDVREKSVLLGFVEAVNLVNENDGAMAGTRFVLGDGHDFLNFFDAGQDRAEGNEFGASQPGDQASQSGLPAAGRAPEEHGAKVVAFDLNAERLARAEQFFLADEFVERARAHALGKRLVRSGHVGFRG